MRAEAARVHADENLVQAGRGAERQAASAGRTAQAADASSPAAHAGATADRQELSAGSTAQTMNLLPDATSSAAAAATAADQQSLSVDVTPAAHRVRTADIQRSSAGSATKAAVVAPVAATRAAQAGRTDDRQQAAESTDADADLAVLGLLRPAPARAPVRFELTTQTVGGFTASDIAPVFQHASAQTGSQADYELLCLLQTFFMQQRPYTPATAAVTDVSRDLIPPRLPVTDASRATRLPRLPVRNVSRRTLGPTTAIVNTPVSISSSAVPDANSDPQTSTRQPGSAVSPAHSQGQQSTAAEPARSSHELTVHLDTIRRIVQFLSEDWWVEVENTAISSSPRAPENQQLQC